MAWGVYISSSVRNWEGWDSVQLWKSVFSISTCLISILSFLWDGIKHPLPVTCDYLGHIYSSLARCLWRVSSTQCEALESSLPSQRVISVFTFLHFSLKVLPFLLSQKRREVRASIQFATFGGFSEASKDSMDSTVLFLEVRSGIRILLLCIFPPWAIISS